MNNFRIEGFTDADYRRLKMQMGAENPQKKSALICEKKEIHLTQMGAEKLCRGIIILAISYQ